MIPPKDTIRIFYKNHRALLTIISIAFVIVTSALLFLCQHRLQLFQPEYLTVSEVWERRSELNGQRITVRGFVAYIEIYQTLLDCFPQRCDCNETRAYTIALTDKEKLGNYRRGFREKGAVIEIDILDCYGNECYLSCEPINPYSSKEYEFNGVLRVQENPPILQLDEIHLGSSRMRPQWFWEPIPTGVFEIDLELP